MLFNDSVSQFGPRRASRPGSIAARPVFSSNLEVRTMSCVKGFFGLFAAILVVAATVGIPTVVQAGDHRRRERLQPCPHLGLGFKHDGLHCHVRHGPSHR